MEIILVATVLLTLIGLAIAVELSHGVTININLNNKSEDKPAVSPMSEEALKKFEEAETARLAESMAAINAFMRGDDDIE